MSSKVGAGAIVLCGTVPYTVTVSLPVTLAALIDQFVPVLQVLLWRGGSRRNDMVL